MRSTSQRKPQGTPETARSPFRSSRTQCEPRARAARILPVFGVGGWVMSSVPPLRVMALWSVRPWGRCLPRGQTDRRRGARDGRAGHITGAADRDVGGDRGRGAAVPGVAGTGRLPHRAAPGRQGCRPVGAAGDACRRPPWCSVRRQAGRGGTSMVAREKSPLREPRILMSLALVAVCPGRRPRRAERDPRRPYPAPPRTRKTPTIRRQTHRTLSTIHPGAAGRRRSVPPAGCDARGIPGGAVRPTRAHRRTWNGSRLHPRSQRPPPRNEEGVTLAPAADAAAPADRRRKEQEQHRHDGPGPAPGAHGTRSSGTGHGRVCGTGGTSRNGW